MKKAGLAFAATLLASCSSISTEPSPIGSWFNPPTEFPGICMTFAADGSLSFKGGFEYWNPARWSYDKNKGELIIALGGSGTFPLEPLEFQKSAGPETIYGFNSAQREMMLPFPPRHEYLAITTFHFFREPCS